MLKVVMVRGRRLKKGGGDLEIHKQNVASLKQTISKQNVVPLKLKPKEQNVTPSKLRPEEKNVAPFELGLEEQNVAPSKLKIDEPNNLCGLELIMMTICNSNGEISLNID
jgi:hypothetical protein